MYRIFISYSSRSKPIVAKLAEDLGITGHEIWFDHQLTGGQAWWDQILEQIRQCDVFIFALTAEALDSYACRLEYTYAHKLGKPVLPVKMDEDVPIHQLPNELQLIQFVDYTSLDTQAAFRLVSALNSAPPAAPLPDPLPKPPPVPLSYVGKLREQIDSPELTFDEQASIVFKLKERLQEGDSPEEARGLLERLRRRDDLYAKIDREIEDILQSSRPVSARLFSRRDRERQPDAALDASQANEERRATQPAPATQRALASGSRRIWLPLVIGSAIIGAVGGFLFSGLLYDLWRYGDWIPIGALVIFGVPLYVLHGYFTARIVRGVTPRPDKPMTLGWAARSALMGGPLNGLILKRVSPRTGWGHVILVAVGWIIVAFASYIVADAMFSRWSSSDSLAWGILTGIGGALVTYLGYRIVRE